MLNPQKLGWYVRRLSRMSVREIAHRLGEQAHRRADRGGRWGWAAFGAFDGQISGLPGLASDLSSELAEQAALTARDAERGRFRFLSQDWPEPSRTDWWTGDIWFLDPVSGLPWPGVDLFAFDVAYRHEHARGDVKFVWEINRLQFLPALAASREEGVGVALDILSGWMAANPPYQGINWTAGIEAASRLVSVLAMLTLARRTLTDAETAPLRAFIEAHARWIDRYPSLYSSANNHRVAEWAALFIAGTAAPGMKEAPRYRREGRAGLEREILLQFHPDGVGAEQSPTYAAYSLEWFVLAARAADAAGAPVSAAYRARALAAANHLQSLLDDAGRAPRIGDDDEGRALAFTMAQDPCYPQSVAVLTQVWLGEPSEEIGAGLRTFAQGGYTVARSKTSSGDALLVFDHAPLGFLSIAAHGHADALAVWLHWGEEPVIVDAGTYLYHSGGEDRDAFRGTPAHNTLCLDGRDQSRIAGPFNWSDHAHSRLVKTDASRVVAEHGGYRSEYGLTHRRAVMLLADGYAIEDQLIGTLRQPSVGWKIGYLLHPSVRADIDGEVATLVTPMGRRLRLAAGAGTRWSLEDGWYSAGFNQRAPTKRLSLDGDFAPGADSLVARVSITRA